MEKPVVKEKSAAEYIEHLEKELDKYRRSPYLSTYNAIYNQLQDWNDQLTIKEAKIDGIDHGIPIKKGKIDIFGESSQKEFDRAFKYFTEAGTLLKQLDEIRKLMNPEEQKKLEELNKDGKMRIAERLALDGKKS